jgi:hypothetical protein
MTTKRGPEDVSIGVRDGTRLTITAKTSDGLGIEVSRTVVIRVCPCLGLDGPCRKCGGTGVEIERVK